MWLAIGAVLGMLCASFLAKQSRTEAYFLIVIIALFYVGFAGVGDMTALGQELVVAGGISIAALSVYITSNWRLVAALILIGHGVFDMLHDDYIENAGVPHWWGVFCAAFDIGFAMVLLWLSRRLSK